jgi:hypothetical protein
MAGNTHRQIAHGCRWALLKLMVALMVFAALIPFCFWHTDLDLRGVVMGLIVLVVFPSTVLLGIDASRTIRREMPAHESVRILGVVLGIPQGILGAILVSIAVFLPFVGMYDLAIHHLYGTKSGLPALYLFASVVSFIVGYHYLKDILWLMGIVNKQSTKGW